MAVSVRTLGRLQGTRERQQRSRNSRRVLGSSETRPRRVLVGSSSVPGHVPSRSRPGHVPSRTRPGPVLDMSTPTGTFDLRDGGLVHRGVEVVFDAPPQRGLSSLV